MEKGPSEINAPYFLTIYRLVMGGAVPRQRWRSADKIRSWLSWARSIETSDSKCRHSYVCTCIRDARLSGISCTRTNRDPYLWLFEVHVSEECPSTFSRGPNRIRVSDPQENSLMKAPHKKREIFSLFLMRSGNWLIRIEITWRLPPLCRLIGEDEFCY